MNAEEILAIIQNEIVTWHRNNENRADDFKIVTDDIRNIRVMGEHRSNLYEVARELAQTNLEIWHEEDKARLDDDAMVVRAKRNIDVLNQHRNDLMEELDEIVMDKVR